MVGLTAEANSLESSQMSSQSSPCKCKSEPAQGSANTSPLHPLLYVRYKDHVIYKNILQPIAEAAERETVGWLTKQNEEIMLMENDRTTSNRRNTMRPRQRHHHPKKLHYRNPSVDLHHYKKIQNCHLNSHKSKGKGEYRAFAKEAKNSTFPKPMKEANNCKH